MTLHDLAEAFLVANKNRLSPNTLRATILLCQNDTGFEGRQTRNLFSQYR